MNFKRDQGMKGYNLYRLDPKREGEMITRSDIAYQVTNKLLHFRADYDIESIVDSIVKQYGLVDIGIIPSKDFWKIVNYWFNPKEG